MFPRAQLAVFLVLMLDFKLRSIYLQMKDAWMREICSGVGDRENDMGDEEISSGTTQTGTFGHTQNPACWVTSYPALVRVLECLEALGSEVCPAQLFIFIYVYPLSLSLFFFFLPLGTWDLNSQTWYPTCVPCIGSRVLTTGLPGKPLIYTYF